MTKGGFKCTRCDRTFKLKAHLARHNNTIHGGGKKTQSNKTPKKSKKKSATGSGVSMMDAMPSFMDMADHARILKDMTAYRDSLLMHRSSIDSRIAGIENAISMMGSSSMARNTPTGKRGRGRPPGGGASGSLTDMIVMVLRQSAKPLTPREISQSVIQAGYRTKSSNLTKAVSNALPKISGIKRVGHGMYRA